MSRFTVISFYTPDFACFAPELTADCERFGYPCHIEEVEDPGSLTATWDRKVEFIGDSIRRFGTVLWMDVECRLLAPIPDSWRPPLTSTFPMGESRPVSTGVLMLDRSHLPLVDVWSRHARKHANLPDDFVLEFLLGQYDLPFTFVETEFFDREKPAQIVRGQWMPEGAIVQHSTINRWPDPVRYALTFNGAERSADRDPEMRIARKRKSLFWRNFGGDFEEVQRIMASNSSEEHCLNGWVFDPAQQEYAPVQYWPEMPEIFGVKPLTRAKFYEHTGKGFQENPFRRKMLRRMRLESEERSIFPSKRPRFFGLLNP